MKHAKSITKNEQFKGFACDECELFGTYTWLQHHNKMMHGAEKKTVANKEHQAKKQGFLCF